MEEADVLCDRLAIMSDGALMWIGTSDQLKQRYGRGFTFSMTVADRSEQGHRQAVRRVRTFLPSAVEINDVMSGSMAFEVLHDEVDLAEVFETMHRRVNDWGITDWAITDASLEEVFLKVALAGDHFASQTKLSTPMANSGSHTHDMVNHEVDKICAGQEPLKRVFHDDRGTLKQKISLLNGPLGLDANLAIPKAIQEANAMMGLAADGNLMQQADALLELVGV